jgi:hypothetical protein
MKPIIGLFRREVESSLSVNRLKEAGYAEEEISVLTQESAIRKLLGCEPTCVVSRYAAWGISFGIAIYAIFGMVAGWCQCNLLGFGQVYGFFTVLGVLLAGAIVGGLLGCIVGVAEFEKDSHLYVQGARLGGRVIVVQASEEDAERVKRILEQENASGVKAL